MLNNKLVAVVVPCYNEETQIKNVINTMPAFVDRIVIVNDKSTDDTLDIILNLQKKLETVEPVLVNEISLETNAYNYADKIVYEMDKRESKFFTKAEVFHDYNNPKKVVVINHLKNGGVGAAIASGYKWCKDHKIACTAVMAGDGQMDPAELESICEPVINENIDYVKGNRLIHRSAWLVVPKIRYIGNSVLSVMTKLASGYWHVSDTQTGYTAISLKALRAIRIHKIFKSYGMPNDMLVKLNIAFCTIREVEIKPVYNVGEQSKMKILKVIPKISWLLFKSFFKRLWVKYLFRDFHPLFLLYNFSFLLNVVAIPFLIRIIKYIFFGRSLADATLIAFIFLFISAFQSLGFAMWMDIMDNERLQK